ncbi:MAG: DNA polymerase III subunit delta [Ignavibacteria bacterium RBG_13_36_8]|nr:MAG: DNA polymerase III subunit delta [Ignavibacteria bacterium RBG_13_36_8]
MKERKSMMSKGREKIPSIHSLSSYLKKDKWLPIYFLCGEDSYAIDSAVKSISDKAQPLLASDFDREVINIDKNQNISEILDLAAQFPFGAGKKLIVVKNFEKISEKQNLSEYVNKPPDFTILVITQSGRVSDMNKEPYYSLLKNNYLFEARSLKGDELIIWLINKAKAEEIILDEDIAQTMIEIIGEDKWLLEMHIQKFFDYLGKKSEITFELVRKMVSSTKEYSIFDLLETLGKGDKSKSIEIAYNLLENGKELVFVITMLSRFITTIAQILELNKKNISDREAAKEAGVSIYYYLNCKKAEYFLSHKRLLNAIRALFDADITLKTTSFEPKSLIAVLISKMLQ